MSLYGLLDPAVVAGNTLLIRLEDLVPCLTGGPASLAAVVVLTVLVRLLLLPLAVRGAHVDRRRAALAPQLARLRRLHAGDRQRLAQETARLHRSAGIGPFAGLGPMLLQLPVLSAMYRALGSASVAGVPSAVGGALLFGRPLSATWVSVLRTAGAPSAPAVWFMVLLLGLAAVAYLNGRQQKARLRLGNVDAADPMAGRIAALLPFGSVAFAVIAPVAVTVYLLTTTTWTVLERAVLARLL